MKTFEAMDKASAAVLESIASVLCHSQEQRDLLQEIYKLGFKDGELVSLRKQINK